MANQCRKEGISRDGGRYSRGYQSFAPDPNDLLRFYQRLDPVDDRLGSRCLGNRSIGTAAAGGMLIGTFVGIFLIPGLYVIFESLATYFKKRKEKEQIKEDEYVY